MRWYVSEKQPRMAVLAAVSWVLLPFCGYADTVVIGAGYAAPTPLSVAPGQVVTLFVHVPGKTAADPVSATAPLPGTLGGFSAVLRQTFPSTPVAVPISSVVDAQSCSSVEPVQCDVVSMVTVEIPFELTGNNPRSRLPSNFARVDVSYNGTETASLFLNPVTDRIHVVSSCDVPSTQPGSCVAAVTHADGTAVTPDNPGQPGETLTVALVGLGLAQQSVTTGEATPSPAPAVDGVLISLDARVNQSPSVPVAATSSPAAARMRPAAVGIYEIPFTVPVLPEGVPACATGAVASNLTISVGRVTSFDGVGICVTPTAAPPGGVRSPEPRNVRSPEPRS